MEKPNLKEIMADMIYDQPREKVVEALNLVHSVYDKCRNTINVDESTYNKYKERYGISGVCCPFHLLKTYGYDRPDFSYDGFNYYSYILRYLKDQQKFLSRKLAWIDNGNQELYSTK